MDHGANNYRQAYYAERTLKVFVEMSGCDVDESMVNMLTAMMHHALVTNQDFIGASKQAALMFDIETREN